MKRFNIFSAIGALTIGALALTGCPTTHPDLEYPVLDTSYIYIVTNFCGVEVDEKVYPVGGKVDDNTFHKLPEYEINGSEATTSFKFTNYKGCLWTFEDNTGFAFKLSKEPSWGTDIGTSFPAASVGNEIKADGGSDNLTFTGLEEGGSYIITITARKAGIFVKLESADGTTGGSANDTTTTDMQIIDNENLKNLSDLLFGDSKLKAPETAYFEIRGDSCYDATAGKYFFKKGDDSFVAKAYVKTGKDLGGWGGNTYECWGHIGWGDNNSVKSDSKQWNYSDGKLDFDNAKGNFKPTDIEAQTLYELTVTITESEATIKMEKVTISSN